MKRLFVVIAGISTGVVVGLGIIAGAYAWWDSRPKARDTTSVTGTYDGAYTRKKDGRLLVDLRYVLQNNTQEDIHVASTSFTGFMRRTDGSLFNLKKVDLQDLDELDIPARERAIWLIPVGFSYDDRDGCPEIEKKPDPQKDDLQPFIDACYKRMLGGFLFQSEDVRRLQITLPPPTQSGGKK